MKTHTVVVTDGNEEQHIFRNALQISVEDTNYLVVTDDNADCFLFNHKNVKQITMKENTND